MNRRRLQHDRINHTEQSGISPDAQPQSQDHDDGEARPLDQGTACVSDILEKKAHWLVTCEVANSGFLVIIRKLHLIHCIKEDRRDIRGKPVFELFSHWYTQMQGICQDGKVSRTACEVRSAVARCSIMGRRISISDKDTIKSDGIFNGLIFSRIKVVYKKHRRLV